MKYSIEKSFIGSLFKYYREQNKISRTSISKSNNISISSIRRIEEGGYSSFKMYKLLAKELKLKINDKPSLYTTANLYVEQTYKIINSGKTIDEYVKLRNNIHTFYSNYKEYLYLSELSRICVSTLNMYLTCTVNDTKIINLSKYISNLLNKDSNIHTLVCYLMCLYGKYYARGTNDEDLYFAYSKFLIGKQIFALEELEHNSLKLNKFDFFKKYEKFMTASVNKTDNYLSKYHKLVLKSYYCFISEKYNETIALLTLFIENKEIKNRIPNRIYLHIIENLAYTYLKIGDFNNALNCFLKIIDTNPNIIEIAYANVFVICETLNRCDTIIDILNNPSIYIRNNTVNDIFEYFRMKIINNVDYKELEDFIIKKFSLKSCNSLQCYGAFKNEMSLLTNQSHNYKSFYKYIKENDPYINNYKKSNSISFREEDFISLLV